MLPEGSARQFVSNASSWRARCNCRKWFLCQDLCAYVHCSFHGLLQYFRIDFSKITFKGMYAFKYLCNSVKILWSFYFVSTCSGMDSVTYFDRILHYLIGKKKVSNFWNNTVLCGINQHLLCSYFCVDR